MGFEQRKIFFVVVVVRLVRLVRLAKQGLVVVVTCCVNVVVNVNFVIFWGKRKRKVVRRKERKRLSL